MALAPTEVSTNVTPHPYRWVLLGGLILCAWGVLWYGFTVGILIPDMRDSMGLSSSQQGWLSSAFFFGQVIFPLPLTILLTRFPPLRAMAVGFLVATVLTGLGALLAGYWAQLLIRLGVSMIFVAVTPIRTMIVASWFSRAEVPRANGIFNSGFASVQTAGLWVTGALLGFVGGWREMMVVFFGITAAGAVVWVLIARRAPPPLVDPVRRRAADPVDGSASGGRSWWAIARNRQVLALCLMGVGGATSFSAFLTFWPVVARDSLGLSDAQAGFILGCTSFAIIPASLAAATVLRLVGGRLPFFLLTALVQIPTFACFVLTDSVPLLIAIGLLQGSTWMCFPMFLSVPFDIEGFDQREIALATALFLVVNGIALTVGPSIAGVLGDTMSMQRVLLILSAAPLLSVAGAILLGPERRPTAPAAPTAAGAVA